MNLPRLFPFFAASLLLAMTRTLAQDNAATARQAQIQQDRAAALAHFAAGRDPQAEQALAPTIRRQANTAPWHLALAQAEVQLAIAAARQGEARTADRIIRLALQQIAQATQRARADEAEVAANAWELAGFVHEHFRGDGAEARRSYQQAVQQWAGAETARAALARLEASEKTIRRQRRNGHGG